MLTTDETNNFRSLLARLNECLEGETVVANLLRSLDAKIVDVPLVKTVLNAWHDSVERADTSSQNGLISPEHALRLTESELLSATGPFPLWDKILSSNLFKTAPHGTGAISNIKSLDSVLRYILKITDLPDPHTGDPIRLSHCMSQEQRKRQLDRIFRAMLPLKKKPLDSTATIHHKKWFWVTPSQGLQSLLQSQTNSEAAATAVDNLGLVHFSRNFAGQKSIDRYIVEIRLNSSFAPEYVKPSFMVSDHNPRFVAWTDTTARSDPNWGRSADLKTFHTEKKLAHGYKEMVRLTPGTLLQTDILDFVVLGYLDVNRWGVASETASDTDIFADQLRNGDAKNATVDKILNILQASQE